MHVQSGYRNSFGGSPERQTNENQVRSESKSDKERCVVHSGPTTSVVTKGLVTRDIKANAQHTTHVGSAQKSLATTSLEQ